MLKNEYLSIFVFLSLFFFSATARSSQLEGNYAGDETCMECHEEIYEDFWQNIHGVKGDPRTPAARYSEFVCESCHGPGADHSEEGESGGILWLSAKSPESQDVKNKVCLQCHNKGKVAMWPSSEHETRALSCANCHGVHQKNPKYLAKPNQTEVCAECHRKITPLMLRQSHHPIREGKMKCSNCHNSHGTIADKLIDAQDINLKCFECHADIRGPFMWEHPSAVENCLACHVPHGSARASLLKSRPPYLCQRCHSNVNHTSQLQAKNNRQAGRSVYVALNNRGFYRGCLNCHIKVHGSNHPSGKNLVR